MTNTHITIGGHKVSAGKTYSTSEVRTGDVWIDGKPIYRKVIHTTSSSGTFTIDISSWDIDTPVYMNYVIKNSNGAWTFGNYYNSSTDRVVTYLSNGVLGFTSGSSYAFGDLYVVLEYTKTTD